MTEITINVLGMTFYEPDFSPNNSIVLLNLCQKKLSYVSIS